MVVVELTVLDAALTAGDLVITNITICSDSSGTLSIALPTNDQDTLLNTFNDETIHKSPRLKRSSLGNTAGDLELLLHLDLDCLACRDVKLADVTSEISISYTGGVANAFTVTTVFKETNCDSDCYSVNFSGANDERIYVDKTTAATDHPLDFGAGDFRIDCLVLLEDDPNPIRAFMTTGSHDYDTVNPLNLNGHRGVTLGVVNGAVAGEMYPQIDFSYNDGTPHYSTVTSNNFALRGELQWISFVRVSGTIYIYINGVKMPTTSVNVGSPPPGEGWDPAFTTRYSWIGAHALLDSPDIMIGDICAIYVEKAGVDHFKFDPRIGAGIKAWDTQFDESFTFTNFGVRTDFGGGAFVNSTCCPTTYAPTEVLQGVDITFKGDQSCCYTPTLFETVRRELFTWALSAHLNANLTTAHGLVRIGNKDVAFQKYNRLNALVHLITWALTIRWNMDCTGKCWDQYVTDATVECMLKSFMCYNIDISCVFEKTGIYYDRSCIDD